jgi:xylulokinase
MGVMLSAASCLKWWVERINKENDTVSLLEEAKDTKPNQKLVFLPYLMGERTPYSDPDAKGTFVGMDMNTTREDMTRAVLEGVAFGLRDSLEIIKDMNMPINDVRLIGGGARSNLWKQIIADIFNMPIGEINTNQGGALGAAILAAVGAGVYPDVKTGCKQMVRVVDAISPDKENVQVYDSVYKKYRDLYKCLENWFKV